MTDLLFKELTHKIIGVYFDVFNGTGRTYPEFVYEKAMLHDLRRAGIPCKSQEERQVLYEEWLVGQQQLDLVVADQVIVELKVAPSLTSLHKAQTFSYLKAFNKQVGLLLNFGSRKPQFERLYLEPKTPDSPAEAVRQVTAELSPDLVSPELVYDVMGALFTVHATLGPGLIHRIYANACYRELQHRGLPVRPQKEINVIYRGTAIATIKFAHLKIADQLLVFPVTLANISTLNLNNLTNWLRAEQIPLGILTNFHDLTLNPLFLRA